MQVHVYSNKSIQRACYYHLNDFFFFGGVVLSLVAGQKFKFHSVIQLVAGLCFRVSSDSTEHTKDSVALCQSLLFFTLHRLS